MIYEIVVTCATFLYGALTCFMSAPPIPQGISQEFSIDIRQNLLSKDVQEFFPFQRYESKYIEKIAAQESARLINIEVYPHKSLKALVLKSPKSPAQLIAHNGLSFDEKYTSSLLQFVSDYHDPSKDGAKHSGGDEKALNHFSIEFRDGPFLYSDIAEFIFREQNLQFESFLKKIAEQTFAKLVTFKGHGRELKFLIYEPDLLYSKPSGDYNYIWIAAHNLISQDEKYLRFVLDFLCEHFRDRIILYAPSNSDINLNVKELENIDVLKNNVGKLSNIVNTDDEILIEMVYPNPWLFSSIDYKVGEIKILYSPPERTYESNYNIERLIGSTIEEIKKNNISLVVSNIENVHSIEKKELLSFFKNSDINFGENLDGKFDSIVDKASRSTGRLYGSRSKHTTLGSCFTFYEGKNRFIATSLNVLIEIINELTGAKRKLIKEYFASIRQPYNLQSIVTKLKEANIQDSNVVVDYEIGDHQNDRRFETIDNNSFFIDSDIVVFSTQDTKGFESHGLILASHALKDMPVKVLLVGYPAYSGYGQSQRFDSQFFRHSVSNKLILGVKRVSAGSIFQLTSENFLRHSCATASGSSGSLMVDFNGAVVGIHIGSAGENSNNNKAISADRISELAAKFDSLYTH